MNPLLFFNRAIEKKRQLNLERLSFKVWRNNPIRSALERGLVRRRPVFNFAKIKDAVENGRGLEIGGPSSVFTKRDLIPVYPIVGHLDVCNFGPETMWEGKIEDGSPFVYDVSKPSGRQFIREATDLRGLSDASYDFILSSHCLEHVANPLKALLEWRRIIRAGGHLLLIVPHPHHTFDHRRPPTTFRHLLDDYEQMMGEDDLTHLPEILNLHDFARDPWVKSLVAFEERSRDNVNNRGLHHHVFTPALASQCMQWAGFEVEFVEDAGDLHIVTLGKKP